jgi:predicted RNA-binding protein with TRAM domain
MITFAEIKKKGSGLETIDEFVHFYSGVPKERRPRREISIVYKRRCSRNVTD